MGAALIALVALPMVAGLALLVAGRPAERVAAPVATAVAAVALGLAAVVAAGRPSITLPVLVGLDSGLSVDGLSAVLVVTVTAVALAVVVVAAVEVDRRHRFFGLLLVFLGAMLATVTATDLVVLLAAWEVMGAMSYALIAHRSAEPGPARSGALAFLVTRTGDLGLYLAAGAALAGGGSLLLAGLPAVDPALRDLAVAGLMVAALGKSAQLPFSFWLARAMDGPSPVSALLHSATMVAAGGYLLLRIEPALASTSWAGPVVAWVGAATVVLLGLVALAQADLKQLLAASTCSQIGFVVLAAGVGGTAGGALQLVAHAATKSLLFLVAGVWLTALGTKKLAGLQGVARRWPLVGAVFVAGSLSLAGVPPLSIFFGKDAVLAAAAQSSTPLYVAGLLGVIVSAAYAAVALAAVLGPVPVSDPGYDTEQGGTREVPLLARMPLVPLTLAAMVLGVATEPVRAALGARDQPAPSFSEALLSGLVAVAIVATTVLAARRRSGRAALPTGSRTGSGVPALRDWLGLERAAMYGVAAPTMALARLLARADDRIVAGAVGAAAQTGRLAARVAELRVENLIVDGVSRVGAASRALGRLARRPQTGQLHQYYAQAVAALAVLAVFLLLVR